MPEQAEAIIEQRRDSTNPKRTGATGGEFDCERDSIKSTTDRADNRRFNVAQTCSVATSCSPLHEELSSRISQHFRGGKIGMPGRTSKGIQKVDAFTFDAQRPPAGGGGMRLRGLPPRPLGPFRLPV